MGTHVASRFALECVGPPLQADLARHWIGDDVANARDFGVEGVERVQMWARRRRREQVCQPSVAVVIVNQRAAMLVMRRERCGPFGGRPAPRSCSGDQGSRDAPLLAEQDVVGPRRRARCHRLAARCRARAAFGGAPEEAAQSSLPVPTSRCSIAPAGSSNKAASEFASICAGSETSQARMPEGSARIEPRCDIPAKPKPPAP